jgi:periplasmic protein CpxP/Spy
MSLKTRILQGITVAAAAFAFAGLTSAQQTTPKTDGAQKHERGEGRGFKGHGEFGRGARGGQGGFGMLRGIQLTDAQKEQLRTIHESNKPDEASMQQMRTLMEARRNGTLTDDQKAQLKTLRDQARQKHDAVQQQVLAILTPEQKQQLEARKAEMEKRREEFRQKRQQWKQQKQESAKPTDS